MEEPPSDSDGLQPQDLSSSCSLPNIFDLTRNAEECLLKANPIVVQTPGWFVNPGTSNGILLPETDPDPLPLPTDQIQPDNAFSNTTVTLSYVSRSHVFSEHSPIYGVPSLGKAFALHPATYDPGKLVTDAGDAALSVDQHCLQQVSVPVGLTACDQFGFMSPAQVVENVAAFCYLQQPPDLQDVENLALETLKSLQAEPGECRFPISVDQLQNGAANGLWNVGPFEGGFPEDGGTNAEGLHRNANPELVFLISRSEEPVVLPNDGFAISLNQDFVSPLDPESPSAEPTEDVFALPQTANSPSGEKQEEEFDSTMAGAAETESPETPTGKTDKTCNTESVHVSDASAEQTDTDALKTAERTDTDGSKTCNDLSSSDKVERKRLPPRARRGVRMEAFVQDFHPVRSSRVCKRKVQTSKSKKKNVLERIRKVADVKKTKEETEVRRSSRRKTTLSTSSSAKTLDAFVQRTKKKTSRRLRNLHPVPVKHQKPTTAHQGQKKSAKRKKKKHKVGRASFFSPQEPEIKLKCLKNKEEKKDVRDDTFTPYVRVQIKDFPVCTVVNYPEDSAWIKQGKRRACGGFVTGVMPATPGLHYGRVCVDAAQRDVLVCCLCGGSANAMDLGDLHGPYYPEGFKSPSKVVCNPQEEDNSDSDSSFRGKRVPECFWTSDSESSSGPSSSKRLRTDGDTTDWFSPPVVPLDANEHWLHEDCAVWSAGVFLVRGKLYGLENAVRLAKASVCSTCQRRGATLGCVFKGCPSKYHYKCALQSDMFRLVVRLTWKQCETQQRKKKVQICPCMKDMM
ncbi:transcription factor 20-like protein [Labeo rohita]|uniref:Transcription factor 20-like protein n=1 Tax=Labeo rohita TaxID=84645 RepID=A0A498NHP6_LABRO|nr:transcription factor 20-like protein [Labeo rohita]